MNAYFYQKILKSSSNLILAPNWWDIQYPFTVEEIKDSIIIQWNIHDWAVGRGVISTWMTQRHNVNHKSQTQKSSQYMIPIVWSSKRSKTNPRYKMPKTSFCRMEAVLTGTDTSEPSGVKYSYAGWWWWCSRSLMSNSCDPMDCLPGSSVYGISQARILEWVAKNLWTGK